MTLFTKPIVKGLGAHRPVKVFHQVIERITQKSGIMSANSIEQSKIIHDNFLVSKSRVIVMRQVNSTSIPLVFSVDRIKAGEWNPLTRELVTRDDALFVARNAPKSKVSYRGKYSCHSQPLQHTPDSQTSNPEPQTRAVFKSHSILRSCQIMHGLLYQIIMY
jgi:hypothetical protein